MNISYIPSTSPQYIQSTNANLYLLIAFGILSIMFFLMIKCINDLYKKDSIPQVAVLIEIPIAVSISIQTVDEDHIGTVI
jgi:hypothetical protein